MDQRHNACALAIYKTSLKDSFLRHLKYSKGKTLDEATKEDIYESLSLALKEMIMERWFATKDTYQKENPKELYYLSIEFLIGRALGNNMLALDAEQAVNSLFEELDLDFNLIEDLEHDPGLGNGGLGRLAACFLDSLATLELPGHGAGIKYKYGLFKQRIREGYQFEEPDNWLETGELWLVKRQEDMVEVKFGGSVQAIQDVEGKWSFVHHSAHSMYAVPYDMPILGYGNNTVNTLRLWDAEPVREFDFTSFDKGNFADALTEQNLAESITQVLYPNDLHPQGRELRLRQQYFLVSATVQWVVKKFIKKSGDLDKLHEKVVLQLNDTHPAITVAELMRVLMDDYDLGWEQAWNITTKTCAYTNHTIMKEALEEWSKELVEYLLPRIYQIILEIDRRFIEWLKSENHPQALIDNVAIIKHGKIRMAPLAVVGSFSVNGVSALHGDILKGKVLADFHQIYPNKLNHKTNGITQRRWLLKANPSLSQLITSKIGDGWVKELSELRKLEAYLDDKGFLASLQEVKLNNKKRLAEYILKHTGIPVDPNSIFDIQVKRLHEYKRQLLNALHILYLYNELKIGPDLDIVPRTFIFGAKASPGYLRAKLIIKLINSIADLINGDPDINNKLKVVFLENYRVSLAEIIIPAADVSEQISTASMEASGTGNMKFMLNGALTIGTLDGANVEIVEEVGEENAFIFGLKAEEVLDYIQKGDYNPWELYQEDPTLHKLLNQLINGFLSPNNPVLFREIFDNLLSGYHPDAYFILKDFPAYIEAQKKVDATYRNKELWAQKALINVARSGRFSSDRTIKQYAEEIWGLERTPVVKEW